MSVTVAGNQLSTEGLRVEVPGRAGPFVIELGPSSGVSGTYEQTSELIGLRHLAAAELLLRALELKLANGEVRLRVPGSLQKLEVDAEIPLRNPSGLFGRASLESLSAQKLDFGFRGLHGSGSAHLEGVVCEQTRHNARHLSLKKAELTGVELQLNGRTLHVGRIVLSEVELAIRPDGSLIFSCGRAKIGAVVLASASASFELDGIRLPAGVRLDQNMLSCQELEVDSLRVNLPQLAKGPSEKAARPRPAVARSFLLPDLPFLDHLHGRLHADVTLDVSLPIIKSRRATHSLRVPIDAGAINFKHLERSLAGLEDAVLDFEVTEDALIFERDIVPGITLDNQTLISWPLQGADHDLAKRHKKVRLRKLLEYRLSPALLAKQREPSATDKAAIRLTHLDVDNLDIQLSLSGPSELRIPDLGTFQLGTDKARAIDRFELQGSLHYSPDQPRDATELSLEVERILLGALFFDLFGRQVELETLQVAKIEKARLRLLGVQPAAASATARGIRVARLKVPEVLPG